MWAIRKGKPPLPAFVATVVCLATLNSTAQQQPVTIEHADLWGHYIRPLRMIHSPDAEARQFDAAVVLEVIVSVGGNVESALAIDGPKKFFSEAEAIEREMQFLSDQSRAKILGLNIAKMFKFDEAKLRARRQQASAVIH